jgi:predicted PurR-regulated permease PerM
MNGVEQALLIILSAFLALFLFLGIMFLVLCIKLVKQIRQITEHAEHIAEKAEAVTEMVGKAAGPVAVGKILLNIVESVRSQTKGGKDGK